jgi:hypothetical protein
MPDIAKKLSECEKTEIRQKIDSLWVGSAKNCPVCGSNQWFIADHIVEAPITIADILQTHHRRTSFSYAENFRIKTLGVSFP